MNTQTTLQPTKYEQTIIAIMRRLPPERLPYLVEFARFLEFQTTHAQDDLSQREKVDKDFDPGTEVSAGEAKWDELLAKPEAKRLIRQLAREARAEYLAGDTTEIQITEDGRLAPG